MYIRLFREECRFLELYYVLLGFNKRTGKRPQLPVLEGQL